MRYFMGLVCVLVVGALAPLGCSENKQQEPDLEWPPNATAYFDEYGILNADCEFDEDCAMVLGYYHAADRFVQMDFFRRFATGRLAEILDKAVAQTFGVADLSARIRALFSTREGVPLEQATLQQSSPKTVALLEAYSAGVNQWLEDVRSGKPGAVFPRELSNPPFVYGPEDVPAWTPQDSIATVLALIESLTNEEARQVDAGLARAEIDDDDKFSDLWSRRPYRNSVSLPPDWTPPSADSVDGDKSATSDARQQGTPRERFDAAGALQRLHDRLELTRQLLPMISAGASKEGIGSNCWVISSSLSATGHAFQECDGHLAMTQPATYYVAHLDAKTHGSGQIHVAGFTLAGLPWVIQGQTEGIAWGNTNTFYDLTDVYIEELVKDAEGIPTGVMFDGEAVPFTRVPYTVVFVDGETEEHEMLFVPHHGTVREIDADNNVAVTLRWAASDITTDANYLTEMNVAASVDEARAALESVTAIAQNVLVADTQSNIAWFPYSRVPRRTWATNLDGPAPPWLPLDGTGAYEWTEYFSYAELPQQVNPDEGFIANSNNDMTGALSDGDPTTLPSGAFHPPYQVDVAPGYRRDRVVELIEETGSQHNLETMHRIQNDIHSSMGKDMVPGIVAIAEDELTDLSPEAEKVVSALKAWQFSCPTGLDGLYSDSPLTTDTEELSEASGCAAFHATLLELCERIHENEHAQSCRYPSFAVFYSIVDPEQLGAGDIYWDDPDTLEVETKHEVMTDALDAVYDLFVNEKGLGTDEQKWAWGRMHGLVLTSDLAAFGITRYNNPPSGPLFANPGGTDTVSAARPDVDLVQRVGPADRFVCEMNPSGPTCTLQLPGGQSAHIDSTNYEDLLLKFLKNEPIDLVFDIDEAKANAVRTVTFE